MIEKKGDVKLGTRSLAPGTNVYGEDIVRVGDEEFRVWDPYRSKLAAAILKGLQRIPFGKGSKVLYLGAASGTTVSHIGDIVGSTGRVYCVEFAKRAFRDLVDRVSKNWKNTLPIFEDARFPSRYRSLVSDVDSLYSDIAQPDQGRIVAENLDVFSNQSTRFLIAIKARSVDVTRDPNSIFLQEAAVLRERGYEIEEMIRLDPFEKDHSMIRGRR
ncbi:MAG TPA: fibrillarin-like rRNA/tRNA 2'-O-methyltransferase [Candidatus Bathyarchaeia archaeon]|nr:fibrillarin-like rRNA/tRNA 2'-O-methyltransferase [Candidatus Bathyarchaeia archaeon]